MYLQVARLGSEAMFVFICTASLLFLLASNAAGLAFLAKNKVNPGVVELPSGLQYRVLKVGAGTVSPSASTPCACDYRGSLIDGTEFDSSYKRGRPSTFAPNQVLLVPVRLTLHGSELRSSFCISPPRYCRLSKAGSKRCS